MSLGGVPLDTFEQLLVIRAGEIDPAVRRIYAVESAHCFSFPECHLDPRPRPRPRATRRHSAHTRPVEGRAQALAHALWKLLECCRAAGALRWLLGDAGLRARLDRSDRLLEG